MNIGQLMQKLNQLILEGLDENTKVMLKVSDGDDLDYNGEAWDAKLARFSDDGYLYEVEDAEDEDLKDPIVLEIYS